MPNFNVFKFDSIVNNNLPPNYLLNGRFPSLDGLRAISIIIVVIAHFSIASNFIFLGLPGVDIFFVISGFLNTTLILKEKFKTGKVSVVNFYIRRFFRIVPAAYIFLIILFIINLIFQLKISNYSFWQCLFFFRKNGEDFYTKHFWSLSVEIQFYIFFIYLMVRNIKIYIKTIFVLLIILPVCCALDNHKVLVNTFFFPIHHVALIFNKEIVAIFIGSLTSIFLFYGVIRIDFFSKIKVPSLLLFVGTLFGYNFYHNNSYIQELTMPYLFPLIVAVVITVNLFNNKSIIYIFLNTPIMKKLGQMSYSIYLWQQIFTYQQPWDSKFLFSDTNF